MGQMSAFFQPVEDLFANLLRLRALQRRQVMLGLLPDVVVFAQQRSKASAAEEDAGLLMQVQAQLVNRPDGIRQSKLLWIALLANRLLLFPCLADCQHLGTHPYHTV